MLAITSAVVGAILLAGIIALPAFGQGSGLTVSTDMPSYTTGDTITITGTVERVTGDGVAIQIKSADIGRIIAVVQTVAETDGTFSATVVTGGSLWSAEGEYVAKVQYGQVSGETTFTFVPGEIEIIEVEETAAEQTLDLDYTITGGSVISITPDPESHSIIVRISATDDGELVITLPRDIIDAKMSDGTDDELIVLVDYEERTFTEFKNNDTRTLTIGFESGAQEIEIIGTMVIPEFGTIAALILAVAIGTILAVSSRTRLAITPRY